MTDPLKKYEFYRNENGVLYCGDCLEILPYLPEIGLVLCDPPYGMDNDVDSSRFSGGTAGHIAKRGNGGRFKTKIIGDDKPFDPRPFMRFNSVILWGSNFFAKYLPVGTTLVWLKRYDDAFGSFLSDAEIAWMKGGCGVYARRDVSLLAVTRERVHPNQKPVSLMMWCIEKSKTDGIVADFYLGSGTTAIAAERLNRKWIGIEISEDYCKIAQKRIEKERSQLRLPGF